MSALVLPDAVDPVAEPLPGRAVITQRWRHAVFLHWRVDPADVTPWLPPGTYPDVTPDGSTWVGLIPFRLEGSRFPPGPRIPWLGTFLETNVRLYSVDDEGRRGDVPQPRGDVVRADGLHLQHDHRQRRGNRGGHGVERRVVVGLGGEARADVELVARPQRALGVAAGHRRRQRREVLRGHQPASRPARVRA